MAFRKKKNNSSFDKSDIDSKNFRKYHKYSKIEVPDYIYVKDSKQAFAFDVNNKNVDNFNKYNMSALIFGLVFIVVNANLLFKHLLAIVPVLTGEVIFLPEDLNLTIYEYIVFNSVLATINFITLVSLTIFEILILTRTEENKYRAMIVYAVCGIISFILRLGIFLLSVPVYSNGYFIVISLANIILTLGGIVFIKLFIMKPKVDEIEKFF